VPYDETAPVHTFWDLGWSDCTSILFAQKVGFDFRIIDAYQSRLEKLPHYLKVLQDRGYVYGMDYMPHDADHESLATKSIKKMAEAAGRKVTVMPRVEKKQHGINAVRSIFNRCWIDETKCADFLQAVRHYRYEIDEHGQWSREPLHDENSHFADALQTLGAVDQYGGEDGCAGC
jgi:phage terminase large subunit